MINETEFGNTPKTDLLEDELWMIDKPPESIIKDEYFRKQLLHTVPEQLTMLKQGNEIHQFNGMNTLHLKHFSTLTENQIFQGQTLFASATWLCIGNAI